MSIARSPDGSARAAGWTYLFTLPKMVPPGRVLVHNTVRPTRRLGSRGFRAWLSVPDPERLDVCGCDWAPELGRHFRIRTRTRTKGGDR